MRKTLEGASPGALDRAERAARLSREASLARSEHETMMRQVDERTAKLKAMRLERDRIAGEAAAAAELVKVRPKAKPKAVRKAKAS